MADATALHVVPGDFSDSQRVANAINQYDALLKKGWRNVRLAKTGPYTVANFDKTNTIALGGNAFYTLTFNAASGYDSDFVVNVLNEDTGRAKRISPNGIASFLLWPSQTCFVYNDNGTWVVNPLTQRWVLPADTTFFINNVSGNDNNDGLASGAGAFLSFVPINKLIGSLIDTNQKLLIISLAAGQSWSNFALTVPIVGGGTIFLDGNNDTITTTNANAAVTCATSTGGGAFLNASFAIQNMTITGSGGGHGLSIASGMGLIHSGVTFGAITGGGSHIQVDGNSSRLICDANYTVSGGASSHLVAVGGGLIDYNGAQTITVSGTPAFGFSFALATILGEIVSFVTWSGAATGTRYFVDKNSVIWTNGAGANYFPGNVVGVSATGGQYG